MSKEKKIEVMTLTIQCPRPIGLLIEKMASECLKKRSEYHIDILRSWFMQSNGNNSQGNCQLFNQLLNVDERNRRDLEKAAEPSEEEIEEHVSCQSS